MLTELLLELTRKGVGMQNERNGIHSPSKIVSLHSRDIFHGNTDSSVHRAKLKNVSIGVGPINYAGTSADTRNYNHRPTDAAVLSSPRVYGFALATTRVLIKSHVSSRSHLRGAMHVSHGLMDMRGAKQGCGGIITYMDQFPARPREAENVATDLASSHRQDTLAIGNPSLNHGS